MPHKTERGRLAGGVDNSICVQRGDRILRLKLLHDFFSPGLAGMLGLFLRAIPRSIARRPPRFGCDRLLRMELLEARATPAALVAAYSFDEGVGGTVGDSSGNVNSGTIGNATWTASGKFGSALSFNGTSALVTIADVGVAGSDDRDDPGGLGQSQHGE